MANVRNGSETDIASEDDFKLTHYRTSTKLAIWRENIGAPITTD